MRQAGVRDTCVIEIQDFESHELRKAHQTRIGNVRAAKIERLEVREIAQMRQPDVSNVRLG